LKGLKIDLQMLGCTYCNWTSLYLYRRAKKGKWLEGFSQTGRV